MDRKPEFWSSARAAAFQDQSVVDAYRFRAPYPPETFDILRRLLVPGYGTVLDVGCGSGQLARRLAPLVERVDAVDVSAAMLTAGRALPNGDAPNLRWVLGRAEDAPLDPPYGLITAGSSMHWMNWSLALPRFHDLLAPGGFVAMVFRRETKPPWAEGLAAARSAIAHSQIGKRPDIVFELEERGLFHRAGMEWTQPVTFRQPLDEYVESFFSRSGSSRERLNPEAVATLDRAVRQVARPYLDAGMVVLEVRGLVVWGYPAPDIGMPRR